jgi:hypothetical protein
VGSRRDKLQNVSPDCDCRQSVHATLLQVPPVTPAPQNSVQSIREARLQPLKIALQDAIALHTKATGVREALEAEASNECTSRALLVPCF